MKRIWGYVASDLPLGWMRSNSHETGRLAVAVALLDGDLPLHSRRVDFLASLASAWLQGRWDEVLAQAVHLHDMSGFPAAWASFYVACARRRKGNLEGWEEVRARTARAGCPSLALEVTLEEVRSDVFHGRYPLAVEAIEETLADSTEGSIAVHTLFSCALFLGTCAQAMGKFRTAEALLREMRALAGILPADRLRVQCLRRKASLLAESERVEAAERFFRRHEATLASSASPLQRVLHLREQLKLSIMRDDLRTVTHLLAEIDQEVSRYGIAREVFNIDEEQCEVELRMRRGGAGRVRLFEERLRDNLATGNEAAACLMHFLLARVHLHEGRLDEALAQAQKARGLAEKWKYGRTRVRVLLLLSEIHSRRGDRLRAIPAVRAAWTLARRMALPVQSACAEFLAGMFERGKPSLASLFSLFEVTRSLEELRYHLVSCGLFLEFAARLVASDGSATEEPLFRLVERLFGSEAVVFLPGESSVVSLSEGRVRRFPLSDEARALMELVWRRRFEGVDLAEIHALRYSKVDYDPQRHRSRTAMFLARLRPQFREWGVEIAHVANGAGYTLQTEALLVRVEAHEASAAPASEGLTPRQDEILRLLATGVRASGRSLCAELGVKRQTLHRFLAPLVKSGKVEMIGRGKAARYRLRGVG